MPDHLLPNLLSTLDLDLASTYKTDFERHISSLIDLHYSRPHTLSFLINSHNKIT